MVKGAARRGGSLQTADPQVVAGVYRQGRDVLQEQLELDFWQNLWRAFSLNLMPNIPLEKVDCPALLKGGVVGSDLL